MKKNMNLKKILFGSSLLMGAIPLIASSCVEVKINKFDNKDLNAKAKSLIISIEPNQNGEIEAEKLNILTNLTNNEITFKIISKKYLTLSDKLYLEVKYKIIDSQNNESDVFSKNLEVPNQIKDPNNKSSEPLTPPQPKPEDDKPKPDKPKPDTIDEEQKIKQELEKIASEIEFSFDESQEGEISASELKLKNNLSENFEIYESEFQVKYINKEEKLYLEIKYKILDKKSNKLSETKVKTISVPSKIKEPKQSNDKYDKINYYNLRDEYIIPNADQDDLGYCWNFSSTKVFETAVAKKFNELIDISELWTGLHQANRFGDGGFFYYFDNMINGDNDGKFGGVVLENDLPYENLIYTNEKNRNKIKEKYGEYVINDYNDIFQKVNYRVDSRNKSGRNKIKEFIMENSAMHIAIGNYSPIITPIGHARNAYDYKHTQLVHSGKEFKEGDGLHAVVIVGWDDNFKKHKHDTNPGAWIILDSSANYTDNGIVYIPYDQAIFSTFPHYASNISNMISVNGYKLKDEKTPIITAKREGHFINKIFEYNKMGTKFNRNANAKSKNQNVFSNEEVININYNFNPENISDLSGKVFIKYGDIDKNNDFDISFKGSSINIKSKSIASSGTYKVILDLKYKENGIEKSIKTTRQIFVFNELETKLIQYGNFKLNFDSYILNDKIRPIFLPMKNKTENLTIYLSNYSDIKSIEATTSYGKKFNSISDKFWREYFRMYWPAKIEIELSGSEEEKEYELDLKFSNKKSEFSSEKSSLKEVVRNQKLKIYEYDKNKNYIIGGIFALQNGSNLNRNNYFAHLFSKDGKFKNVELEIPEKEGHEFTGYSYYDISGDVKKIEKSNDGKYYIDYDIISKLKYGYNNRYQSPDFEHSIIVWPEFKKTSL